MASTNGPHVSVVARVLATTISIVTCQFAVALIFGQLKPWPALTRHSAFGNFSADMGTTVVLIHTVHPIVGAMDTGVLVVAQEEPVFTLALITAHSVDADLLTSAVVVQTFVYIKTVVPVVCQHESIIASAPIVPGDINAVVNTSTIVVVFTLVNVFAVLAISFVTGLADALEGLWSVLAESVDVTVVCGFRALVSIWDSNISHDI